MQHGAFRCWRFDKPDPLDGPFFSDLPDAVGAPATRRRRCRRRDARRAGLHHGPIHAECRVNPDGVFVLEVAARPIGGLCARALRFGVRSRFSRSGLDARENRDLTPLEELLLRHALGEDPAPYQREEAASGVMMIPIPKRGILRHVEGVEEARAVDGIDEIHITAKPDQLLVPLPEGASYLGFIFARAPRPALVEQGSAAHARLVFTIDPHCRCSRGQIHYNRLHSWFCGPLLRRRPLPRPTGGRRVMCVKFRKNCLGSLRPGPGDWGGALRPRVEGRLKLWEERMKMILNEYRLMPLAEGGPGSRRQAHGRLLFRRERRATPGVRAPAGQVVLPQSFATFPSPSVANRCNG